MVFDGDITAHSAINRQLAVLEHILVLKRVISSLTMVCSVDPADCVVVHIFVCSATLATGGATTGNINAFAAILTITDIQLICLIFQLDIEIVASCNGYVIVVTFTRETFHRCRIQIYRPHGSVLCIAQLNFVARCHLYMRQILLETLKLIYFGSGKIRLTVH